LLWLQTVTDTVASLIKLYTESNLCLLGLNFVGRGWEVCRYYLG